MPSLTLTNSPLVEVVFEIKFKNENLLDYDLLVGKLYSKVEALYPNYELLKPAEMPALLMPFVVQHRFRKVAGGYPLYQTGPGIVTFNIDGKTYEKIGKWQSF